MAQVIKIKRSAVASKIPATTDLALGELAMNTNDGKLFMKKNNGTDAIVEIGAAQTASNVGASGVGVFNQKTGNNFEFKKLVAGTNMTVTDNGTTVTLASTASGGGGGSNPAGSLANGSYVFAFTVNGSKGLLNTSSVPGTWTSSITGGVITITHDVGRPPTAVYFWLANSATAASSAYLMSPAGTGAANGALTLPTTGGYALNTTQFQVTVGTGLTGLVVSTTNYVMVVF